MPYRHPIVSVVGRPISVEQSDNPTSHQMEEVQGRYIAELMRVWDAYKVCSFELQRDEREEC
jgi:2-acylglycerol O-acyltransferase 2